MPHDPPPPDMELAPGASREQLEGWTPPLASDDALREAMEKAFDYRGDVTITRKDGAIEEGYIFDRRSDGATLADCFVRLLPKSGGARVRIAYADIARIQFTGRDTAAGKSWETWVRKYNEKKAAGEKNIGIDPEKLD